MNGKQIRFLREKLKKTKNPAKAKQIRIALGIESAPVVEAVPEPVVEIVPEPVVEVAEVVVEKVEPVAKPKAKRSYRRKKTTTAKE